MSRSVSRSVNLTNSSSSSTDTVDTVVRAAGEKRDSGEEGERVSMELLDEDSCSPVR